MGFGVGAVNNASTDPVAAKGAFRAWFEIQSSRLSRKLQHFIRQPRTALIRKGLKVDSDTRTKLGGQTIKVLVEHLCVSQVHHIKHMP